MTPLVRQWINRCVLAGGHSPVVYVCYILNIKENYVYQSYKYFKKKKVFLFSGFSERRRKQFKLKIQGSQESRWVQGEQPGLYVIDVLSS